MKYRRKPTKTQRVMIALMGIAFAALLAWTVPELIGVFSPAAEDTYSEWVWDLPFLGMLAITLLQGIAGVLLIGSGWHYIEGWSRRRREEREARERRSNGESSSPGILMLDRERDGVDGD